MYLKWLGQREQLQDSHRQLNPLTLSIQTIVFILLTEINKRLSHHPVPSFNLKKKQIEKKNI